MFKKTVSLLTAFVLALTLVPSLPSITGSNPPLGVAASAESVSKVKFAVDNLVYQNYRVTWTDTPLLEDGNVVSVSAANENISGEVTIPQSVSYGGKTYKVTAIGGFAFYRCTDLTSITIPSSVTSIEESAFWDCTGLTSITIPSSVTWIGWDAFSGCSKLESIKVSKNNKKFTSVDGVLYSKRKTELYRYPPKKEGTSYKIPSSVTTICWSAFKGCTGLKSIKIPSSVTAIEESAFSGCTGLTSITIPSSVEQFCLASVAWSYNDIDIFDGCTKLKSINVSKNNKVFASVDGVLYSKDKAILLTCPQAKTGKCSISSSVIHICDNAFDGCSKLESINVSKENKRYTSDDGVLYDKNKTNLIKYPAKKKETSYKIPSSVTWIDKLAFENCTELESINASKSNEKYISVNGVLFNKDKTELIKYPAKKKGTSYKIPSSVTEIGYGAFSDCTSLKSVTIPSSVTEIGAYVFEGCTGLKSITIPKNVTRIFTSIFYGCKNLKTVTMKCIDPPEIYNIFDDSSSVEVVISKKADISEWKDAEHWCDYNIVQSKEF